MLVVKTHSNKFSYRNETFSPTIAGISVDFRLKRAEATGNKTYFIYEVSDYVSAERKVNDWQDFTLIIRI